MAIYSGGMQSHTWHSVGSAMETANICSSFLWLFIGLRGCSTKFQTSILRVYSQPWGYVCIPQGTACDFSHQKSINSQQSASIPGLNCALGLARPFSWSDTTWVFLGTQIVGEVTFSLLCCLWNSNWESSAWGRIPCVRGIQRTK